MSNLMAAARRQAKEDIAALGGDIAAVLRRLEELKREDPNWDYSVKLDDEGQLVALRWCFPEQTELVQEYPDILINDNTYGQNQYGYSLDIGVGIDGFARCRNLWYGFLAKEDIPSHPWLLANHLRIAPRHPDIFASDCDEALKNVVTADMPMTYKLECMHHLEGNIKTNLCPVLGMDWAEFYGGFWDLQRAVSPEIFGQKFNALVAKYPATAEYLRTNIYPDRDHWAHAWVSTHFTCGLTTSGWVEVQNRVNKAMAGPKRTILTAFEQLYGRTEEQTNNHLVAVCQVCQYMSAS